jgi:hypothetical protein
MKTNVAGSSEHEEEQTQEARQRFDRSGQGGLSMNETQRIVEQLKRDGSVLETHAGGTGLITIWLRRPGTGRPPTTGHGQSFPATLTDLLDAVEQERFARGNMAPRRGSLSRAGTTCGAR